MLLRLAKQREKQNVASSQIRKRPLQFLGAFPLLDMGGGTGLEGLEVLDVSLFLARPGEARSARLRFCLPVQEADLRVLFSFGALVVGSSSTIKGTNSDISLHKEAKESVGKIWVAGGGGVTVGIGGINYWNGGVLFDCSFG